MSWGRVDQARDSVLCPSCFLSCFSSQLISSRLIYYIIVFSSSLICFRFSVILCSALLFSYILDCFLEVCPELDVALREHGEAFFAAYGEDAAKPKFHFAMHITSQVLRDGMLLDTWACERKHSILKSAALHIDNTLRFERSVLARALNLHLEGLVSGCLRDWVPRAEPCPELATTIGARSCAVAREMRFMGLRWGQGDVFFLNDVVYELVCAALVEMERSHLAMVARTYAFVTKAITRKQNS